jgi:hypothetical protein
LILQDGQEHLVNKCAGQGDVYGSASCSLSLGERVKEHRARMEQQRLSSSADKVGPVDEWFTDDGQAFVKAELAHAWLLSMDKAIDDLGGHRATGADCKSHARLLSTDAYAAAHPNLAG